VKVKLGICACCIAVLTGTAAAATAVPNQQRLTALFVMDHNGRAPAGNALVPYSIAFQRILGGCRASPDQLTMLTIDLAEQASEVGARNVTNLMMLKAIAHYITWRKPDDCSRFYSLSEGHLENGQPY
jgi:hypothetical protein